MATRPILRLDCLPIEIVYRILAQGPCTNALALSLVDKSLRGIVTNPLVYRYVVELGNDNHGDGNNNESQSVEAGKWWVDRGFDLEHEWSACARWALADMKMREVFLGKDSVDDITTDLLSFLPELISQKHYITIQRDHLADAAHDDRFWRHQFEKGDPIELATRAAFVYTYQCTLLPRNGWEVASQLSITDMRLYPEQFAKYLTPTLNRAMDDFLQDLKGGPRVWRSCGTLASAYENSLRLDASGLGLYWLRCLTFATLMAGIFHGRLKLVIDQRNFPCRHGYAKVKQELRPPLGMNIPFELLSSDMPPPFATPSGKALPFALQHIPVMTSSRFLTDGEWIGYYSRIPDRGMPDWGSMMHDLCFKIIDDEPEYNAVSSVGKDAAGEFTLLGTIDKTTGQVRMTKYCNELDVSWRWSGFMTAFGIVGACNGRERGWFWLWKRAWSR